MGRFSSLRWLQAMVAALALSVSNLAYANVFRTVLVIDASSSMKKTDPTEIRKVAAEIYADLARDGDEIAVTGFDGGVRQSTGQFITLASPADRARVKAAIRAVGNDGAQTDFTAGLREAKRLLDAAPHAVGDRSFVVLLTDGECDPDRAGVFATGDAAATCKRIVTDEIVPALSPAQIYAIGFGGAAREGAFFSEVAARSHGGALMTTRADELPELFARTYAKILGSRLSAGSASGRPRITVEQGAPSLDVVVVGPSSMSATIVDPSGHAIARGDANAVVVDSPSYRFFRISKPAAGGWMIVAPAGRYVALEGLDLELRFVGMPEVVETGRRAELKIQLATSSGRLAPLDFLDRHSLTLELMTASKGCLEALAGATKPVPLTRGSDGVWTASVPAAAAGELCFTATLSPGTEGVLSREATSGVIRVVPPIHLKAVAVDAGAVKQGSEAKATLSLAGSEIGEPLEVELELLGPQGSVVLARDERRLAPNDAMELPLRLSVDRNAPPGTFDYVLRIRPTKPVGYEARAIETKLRGTVVPLTFWERYGTWVEIGLGAFALSLLLIGFIAPARFRKGSVLNYEDGRDPDLPREARYPLAGKAKPGFYRGARVLVGPSGPVRRGGVIELRAGPGGSIWGRPLGTNKVREAPKPDEWGSTVTPPREITLKNGIFRVSVGTRYEIEAAGLTFWYTLHASGR